MIKIEGIVKKGIRDFTKRFNNYPNVFKEITGVDLYPGTINVEVTLPVEVKEDFRIKGSKINEPNQDLIFEKCEINGYMAFRIRPYNIYTGEGGWGDNILEISSTTFIPDLVEGSIVEITLFR